MLGLSLLLLEGEILEAPERVADRNAHIKHSDNRREGNINTAYVVSVCWASCLQQFRMRSAV